MWVASDDKIGQSFVADDPEDEGRVGFIELHRNYRDPEEATRRAIVRAAAAMGEQP
jgi:hypothetical protein